ncbi:DUF572 domain-containing protein [Hamiltosporidium magnivora]|uniref:DUF572 domain-containing protein n=1 Tax=Hamiltosporidium magnivora TaxID=148818 RepID=A0A4V2JWL3_9MICR|nr:DUF572 domain-containing protein [Hamiltosporidium magnivora]
MQKKREKRIGTKYFEKKYSGIRFALPFTIGCITCKEYISKGYKFNAVKEKVVGETYLGVEIYRFHIKCTNCRCEMTLKTDPKNGEYIVEFGCIKVNEIFEKTKKNLEFEKNYKEKEEREDPTKILENQIKEAFQERSGIYQNDDITRAIKISQKTNIDELIEFSKNKEKENELKKEAFKNKMIDFLKNTKK